MSHLYFTSLILVGLAITGFAQQPLQGYNIDTSKITTSGISSGAAQAITFHFAHSSEILGTGVFAGVPFCCGFGGLPAANICMSTPNLVNVPFLITEVNTLASRGDIDALSNIRNAPVWVFHGSRDSVVRPGSGPNVVEMYEHYGANVKAVFEYGAEHAHVTDNYGSSCGASASGTSWITDCDYHGSFELLNYLHGGGLERPTGSTPTNGDFILFDQSEYFDFSPALSSMDTAGFVYIPTGCKDRTMACPLHIAFHGCGQNRGSVGDTYAKRAGYLEVAELNNIIVLFPQTVATISNPQGCWDWWGYLNNYFPTKSGNQNLATHRMMSRLING